MIEYEMGVEIPAKKMPNVSKYPFATMPVGASFFAPGVSATSLGGAAWLQKKNGKEFSIRTVTENGVKGSRAWRIK